MTAQLPPSLDGRHPATIGMLGYLERTPSRLERPTAWAAGRVIVQAAWQLIDLLPDGPELTTALRKLLEAQDCTGRIGDDVDGIRL